MDKNIKLKLNTNELKKIHQEELDIIEKDCLQMEIVLKDLEKDPDAFTITQIITFLETLNRSAFFLELHQISKLLP